MELIVNDANGQPFIVIDYREDEETVLRDLTTGQTLYSLESYDGVTHDDTLTSVMEYSDGISSRTFVATGSRISTAITLARHHLAEAEDDEMPDCPECARSFGPSYNGPCDH